MQRTRDEDAPGSRERVSVVATVFNEADTIDRLILGLAAQSRLPDELVIVDGGSSDGTLARLEGWSEGRLQLPAGGRFVGLKVLSAPGANISAGRNLAIAAAKGPLIAVTDAGVGLAPGWLEAITLPFERGARAVSGFFASDPQGAFETALGASSLPLVGEIDPARFLPSSRSVAFRKPDWSAVGGYPEWLDYCEDLVFDFRLIHRAGQPQFAPEALARFRPRPDLAAFWRQYYRYARGDGKAGLWPLRHAVRYVTYLFLAPGLIWLALQHHALAWLGLAGGLAAMLRRPLLRLPRQWAALSTGERLRALAWLLPIRVTGDLAKMAGYPVGLGWRARHRPPRWKPRADTGRR